MSEYIAHRFAEWAITVGLMVVVGLVYFVWFLLKNRGDK